MRARRQAAAAGWTWRWSPGTSVRSHTYRRRAASTRLSVTTTRGKPICSTRSRVGLSGDQDAIELMHTGSARHPRAGAPGVPFSRFEDGRNSGLSAPAFPARPTLPTSAASCCRILCMKIMRLGVTVYEEWYAERLVSRWALCGSGGYDLLRGRPTAMSAKAVVLARYEPLLEAAPTRSVHGDGMGMAYRLGSLADGYGLQFHPPGCAMACSSPKAAVERADPAQLRGRAFHGRLRAEQMELASRCGIARQATQIAEGGIDGFIMLDLRPIGAERIHQPAAGARLSMEIANIHASAHPHPSDAALLHGRRQGGTPTQRPRWLFAVYEVSCVSVHGPTVRVATPCDAAVFGRRGRLRRCVRATALWSAPRRRSGIRGRAWIRRSAQRRSSASIRAELQRLMLADVGIWREEEGLRRAVEGIETQQRYCLGASRSFRRFSTPTSFRPSRRATCRM